MKASRPNRKSKIRDGGFGAYQHGSTFISANCVPDSNEIPNANTMFSGSGIPKATLITKPDVSGSLTLLGISQLEWPTPKTWFLHLEFRCYMVYNLWYKYFRFIAGRHLDFRLSANLGECWQYLLGFGHGKNVGYLPVIVWYLNPLVRYIVFPVCRPPFKFPVVDRRQTALEFDATIHPSIIRSFYRTCSLFQTILQTRLFQLRNFYR